MVQQVETHYANHTQRVGIFDVTARVARERFKVRREGTVSICVHKLERKKRAPRVHDGVVVKACV